MHLSTFAAEQIVIKKSLGEGSYGQVFEGMLDTGLGEEERVVLKRTKARVEASNSNNGTSLGPPVWQPSIRPSYKRIRPLCYALATSFVQTVQYWMQ